MAGFNPSSGTARLFAAYGNDIVNVTAATGYPVLTNTSNDVEFEKLLDRLFFQNNSDMPLTYRTSTNVWTKEYVGRTPIAKYIKKYKSRMYLGYCAFISPQAPLDTGSAAITFPSRVFYSDLYQGNTLTWGIEWGRNGSTISGTKVFEVTSTGGYPVQDFKATNIKVGDPLFITNGNAQLTSDRPYLVTSIPSAYRLIVDRPFPLTATGQHFWVGSNWFDIEPDDGDVITGFGENATRLLISKLLSLHWYNGTQRQQVKGAPGTSYNRSIINDRYGNTYYFHGSDPKITGIYKYNSVSSTILSKPINKFIQGMATGGYDNVVAWEEGPELSFFLGDLSATNHIEAMTKARAVYNVDTKAFTVEPIADTITASTKWRTGNEEDTYLGTSDDEILQADDGNSYNTAPIYSTVETKVYYPGGSEIICDFPYIQVIGRNLKGIMLKFKLWDDPILVDQEWTSLGECTADKTEFTLPPQHFQASGIQFKVDEIGTVENDWYIEKISIFYKPDRSRLL